MGAIKSVKKTFDYRNNAGAIVIGLNKPAIKTHGSADEVQFSSALDLTYKYVKSNLIKDLKKEFSYE